jgi:cilia- and flagella-associated protein 57
MSGVKLVVKHAFGINTNIRNGLILCEDHHVAYVCGYQVVIYHTESKEQTFIGPTALQGFQSQGITAIACAHKKKFIAIAEKADPVAVVSFYDIHGGRKRKVLNYPDLGSKEIRSIAFSDDCRFCITLGAGPEWNLVLWAVEKFAKVMSIAKVSASDDTPFHQVSFCPWDPTLVLAIGKSAIKVFRISDGQLRPVTLSFRRENTNFISHCWLVEDEKLVIGTEAGEILLLENLEFRAVVYPTGSESPDDIRPISGIVITSRGFAIGTTMGELRFFERNPNIKDQFQMEDSFQIPLESAGPASCASPPGGLCITGLVLGTDDSIICSTDTKQLLTFSLSQLKVIKDGVAGAGSGVEFLMTSFHGPNEKGQSAIIDIDAAMWKPLVVTCGQDRTVRLWNTSDRRLELVKELDDDPTCLSVHPSGMYITVGFASKISIFSVFIEGLEVTGTIICRNCTTVKYSTGGQLLASVNGSNIQVYHSSSGTLVCTLRGHSNKISTFVWQNLDSRLMSVGTDGAVLFWDVFPARCRSEHFNGKAGSTFVAGTGFRDGSRAFVTTAERVVKEIGFNRSIDAAAVETVAVVEADERDFGMPFSLIHLDESRKLLLMCTADPALPGSILCVLASAPMETRYEVLTVHGGPITAICQSYDGMTIFTGDVNGCLFMSEYEVEPGGARSLMKTRDNGAAFEFEDEVLVHRADIEQKKTEIRYLET